MKARHLLALGVIGVWGAVVFACSVDDSNPIVARRDIGLTGGENGEGGFTGDATNGVPICQSYGGTPGAQTLALDVLEGIKTDCRISATLIQTDPLGPAPNNHAIQCFQSFIAAAMQCPGFSLAEGTTDNNKVTCTRAIGDTLSDADLAAFEEDMGIILTSKNVSSVDVSALVATLDTQKVVLVDDSIESGKYTQCANNCKDAGTACVRDAGPAPPKDSGTTPPKDSGTTPPKDSGTDTGAPTDSGTDTGAPKDAAGD